MSYATDLTAQGLKADAEIAALTSALAAANAEIARLTPPPPPPPPPPSVMLYGYSHRNRAKLEAETKVSVNCDRIYEANIPASQAASQANFLPASYTPIVTMKIADWAAAGAGARNAEMRAYLSSITRPTIVGTAHEPEDDGLTAAAFRAMNGAFLDLVASVANPNVRWCVNLMCWWISSAGSPGSRSEDYIPKGRTDFILAWDGYAHNTTTTVASKFDPAVALNKKYGLPFAIAETGNENDASRWVRETSDYAAANKAVFYCYWPSQVGTTPQYYPPPADIPAFRAAALKHGGKAL